MLANSFFNGRISEHLLLKEQLLEKYSECKFKKNVFMLPGIRVYGTFKWKVGQEDFITILQTKPYLI